MSVAEGITLLILGGVCVFLWWHKGKERRLRAHNARELEKAKKRLDEQQLDGQTPKETAEEFDELWRNRRKR